MRLVLACDPSGGIGYKNKLPWNKIEGDLPRFKKLTENRVVFMGRNTWESLPVKPLPNRQCFIITSDPYSIPVYSTSKGSAYGSSMSSLERMNDNACIIGGAQLINSAWHKITEVHLTRVHANYVCDTFVDLTKLENDFSIQHEELNIDHTYQIWKKNGIERWDMQS